MFGTRAISIASVAACSLVAGSLAVTDFSPATARGDESGASGKRVGKQVEQRIELRLVGGDKQEPLAGVDVLLTEGYGDSQKKFGPFTTDDTGSVAVDLPPGFYSLHLSSKKEWPYLRVEKLWKGKMRGPAPWLNLRVTDSGAEKWLDGKRRDDGYKPPAMRGAAPRITYSLLPACELVLRAVDTETGEGLSGAEFFEENALGEEWAHAIDGDNLGWQAVADDDPNAAAANLTDADGNFKRFVGATGGYAYGVARPPAGYEAAESGREVDLDIPYGQERAELVFRFRRAPDARR